MNSTNVFAALGSLKKKKKKKKKKEQGSSKTRGSAADKEREKKEVFWAPAPADVDDEEDDDDYCTSTIPPDSACGFPANSEKLNESDAAVEFWRRKKIIAMVHWKRRRLQQGKSNIARKKKKYKSLKGQKEPQDQSFDGMDVGNTTSETAGTEKAEDASATDVKERLKKVASMKKKKSSKEIDAAVQVAASEAAARSA